MPIIVLSAVGDEDAKIAALDAGADDYVTKPFGPRRAVARLNASCAARRRTSTSRRSASTGSRSTSPRGACAATAQDVHLTPTEYELLRILARNRGRLMTHRSAAQRGVGPAVRRRHAGAAHPHRQPATEDRARRRAAVHPHRVARRLPLRRLTPRAARAIFTASPRPSADPHAVAHRSRADALALRMAQRRLEGLERVLGSTRSSRPPTATSGPRSTTRSGSSPRSRSGSRRWSSSSRGSSSSARPRRTPRRRRCTRRPAARRASRGARSTSSSRSSRPGRRCSTTRSPSRSRRSSCRTTSAGCSGSRCARRPGTSSSAPA